MLIEQKNSHFTIVGMGVTGLSCARFFASRNISFRIVDSRNMPPLKTLLDKEFPHVEQYCGEFYTGLFDKNDVLVISPGMALGEPEIARALEQGAKLSSDIELFLAEVNRPVVAITGSNGKSTVTSLVGEIFKNAGMKTCVAGNIGLPVLEQIIDGQVFDVFVLELSSFQLERLSSLSAKAVTILNVTEDHMDRYEDFAGYLSAKQRIFTGAENIIVNRDDPLTAPINNGNQQIITFGMSEPAPSELGVLQYDGREWIVYGQEHLFPVDELKIKGRHNIANAMAAMALCKSLDIDWRPMQDTLKKFSGLPHRCEWVGDVSGISFYNDSKATNVGAAVAAIGGFAANKGRLFLIAGGQDKDSDFTPMAEIVRRCVAHVFLIGKDAIKLESVIGSDICTFSSDLGCAVNDAYNFAQAGDIVLLAPACASFDMFKNYEDRGDSFVRAVKKLDNK